MAFTWVAHICWTCTLPCHLSLYSSMVGVSHRSSGGCGFDPHLGLRNRFSEYRAWWSFIYLKVSFMFFLFFYFFIFFSVNRGIKPGNKISLHNCYNQRSFGEEIIQWICMISYEIHTVLVSFLYNNFNLVCAVFYNQTGELLAYLRTELDFSEPSLWSPNIILGFDLPRFVNSFCLFLLFTHVLN